MALVTSHALDTQGQPLVIAHVSLDAALAQAAHLPSGGTPIACEIAGRRFGTPLILALLDARRDRQAGVEQAPRSDTCRAG